MGSYSRKDTYERTDPPYMYEWELTNKRRIFGYDLDVKGYPVSNPFGDGVSFHKYFWKRPSSKQVQEYLDKEHQSRRAGKAEVDWDKKDKEELEKILAQQKAAQAKMLEQLKEKLQYEQEQRLKKALEMQEQELQKLEDKIKEKQKDGDI